MGESKKVFDEQLFQLLELHAATTKGSWVSFVEGRDHTSGSDFIMTGENDIELSGATIADQDFIAAAHEIVPILVNELLELRRDRRL